MFVNLVPPVTVTFDDLFHFDFTVKPRRHNMYYFLRIEVVAFDLEHPQVCCVAMQLWFHFGFINKQASSVICPI